MWLPQPQSPAFVVSAASLPPSLCELAVAHWSQLEKVVTVPNCSRGSSHPRQSSYICTTHRVIKSRSTDIRCKSDLKQGYLISWENFGLVYQTFRRGDPRVLRPLLQKMILPLSKFFQHFSIQVYRKQVEF